MRARAHASRRLTLLLIVGACVAVLGGAFLWALPEIVRRAVVAQVPKMTGRAVSVEDIDLNLFTGRLVLKKLRLAERDPAETFVSAERIDLRVSPLSLVLGHLRLAYVTLTAPKIRIVRTGPVDFNFSDLLARLPPADPNKPKSRWTVSVGRLALLDGAVLISDRAVSPARDWKIQGITVEAGGLTTRAAQQPGHLDIRARINEAPLDANAGSVILTPGGLAMHLALDRFDLTQVRPYLPPGLPVSLESGIVGLALEVQVERGGDRLARAVVSGDIRVEGLALAQPGRPAAFVKLPRLRVAIKEADLIARSVTVKSVEVDGLDLRAVRDPAGNLDLLALTAGPADAAAHGESSPVPAGQSGSPDATSPAAPFRVTLEKLTVRSGTVTLTDQTVSPSREWRLQGLSVEGAGLGTSAQDTPGTLKVRAQLESTPGPGKPATVSVDADSLRLMPLAATARVALEGFDLGALGPYWPAALPALVREGSLGVTVDAGVERGDAGLSRAVASGSVRLDGIAVVRRGEAAPFLTVPKLTLGVKQADVIARTVALGTIAIEGVDARAARDAGGGIDLLELAAAAPANQPTPGAVASTGSKTRVTAGPAEPAWRVSLDRLDFSKGSMRFEDRAVSPATTHALTNVTVSAENLTWPSGPAAATPGTLKVLAQLDSTPGSRKPATISVDARSFRAFPLAARARVALDGFDLGGLGPYWPASLPALVREGSLGVTLNARVELADTGLRRAVASGNVRLEALAVARRDQPGPFLTVPKLTLEVKQADVVAQSVALGTIAVEGADARVVRESAGTIDLAELIAPVPPPGPGAPGPAAPSAPPSLKPPAPGARPWRINLDRFAFTKGTATFEDRTVSPVTTLALTDLTVMAEQVAWPSISPATFDASMSMPGGGRSEIKGTGKLEPLDVQVRISTKDAPIEPYHAYFPFPARFIGFFSGDSLSEIQRAKNGTLILASRGRASARDFEIRAPGADAPVASLARMEIQGIDFSWPNYALVNRVTLTQPHAEVERDARGDLNLARLFASKDSIPPKAAASPASDRSAAGKPGADAAGKSAPAPGGLMQEMVIDFNEITITDGYLRFLDRTTTPPFSEDLSGFALTIRNASNQMGRQQTSMTAHSTIGGDGLLEMEGQLSGKGEALRVDLALTVKDFALPAVNPYAERLTSWIIERGKLSTRLHYRIEGDHLIADHDLTFAALDVERAQTTADAPQRLGLPLGLAVAMLKDRHGDIDLAIPLRGTLSDQKFDWGEAMWAAARQVIVKLIVSPFNAIGRAFTSGGDKVEKLEVDPVTFAAGSAVIAPAMEAHVTRVADFLRRAPYLKLKLTPLASAADVEALKAQEISARLARLKSERGLRDLAETLRVYYMQQVKTATLPKTVDEQLALLKSREPVPAGPLADLLKHRADATRDRLVKAEGIPAERLTAGVPPTGTAESGAGGDGRVEFAIVGAGP